MRLSIGKILFFTAIMGIILLIAFTVLPLRPIVPRSLLIWLFLSFFALACVGLYLIYVEERERRVGK